MVENTAHLEPLLRSDLLAPTEFLIVAASYDNNIYPRIEKSEKKKHVLNDPFHVPLVTGLICRLPN